MADQPTGEKTEEPTQKRLRDAEAEGQVPRSVDVETTISTFFVLSTTLFLLPYMARSITEFSVSALWMLAHPLDAAMRDAIEIAIDLLLKMVLPILGASMAGAILGNILQFGIVFAYKVIKPDLQKISPMKGLKRIFSIRGMVELAKSALKVTILGFLLYYIIRGSIGPLCTLPFASFFGAFDVVKPMFFQFFVSFMLAYAAIGIVDLLIQRKLTKRDLMMTKEETKREMHEMEGDPMIKGNRRRLQREMIFEDTATATRKSTVLVTNPTHYAAAIYYERGKTRLPVLRAKGTGFVALKMISVAQEERIPIVENVPLAHALCDNLQVNDIIPDELLEPVAEILRWVQTLPPRNPT